jgi:hypothetical protein
MQKLNCAHTLLHYQTGVRSGPASSDAGDDVCLHSTCHTRTGAAVLCLRAAHLQAPAAVRLRARV